METCRVLPTNRPAQWIKEQDKSGFPAYAAPISDEIEPVYMEDIDHFPAPSAATTRFPDRMSMRTRGRSVSDSRG